MPSSTERIDPHTHRHKNLSRSLIRAAVELIVWSFLESWSIPLTEPPKEVWTHFPFSFLVGLYESVHAKVVLGTYVSWANAIVTSYIDCCMLGTWTLFIAFVALLPALACSWHPHVGKMICQSMRAQVWDEEMIFHVMNLFSKTTWTFEHVEVGFWKLIHVAKKKENGFKTKTMKKERKKHGCPRWGLQLNKHSLLRPSQYPSQ